MDDSSIVQFSKYIVRFYFLGVTTNICIGDKSGGCSGWIFWLTLDEQWHRNTCTFQFSTYIIYISCMFSIRSITEGNRNCTLFTILISFLKYLNTIIFYTVYPTRVSQNTYFNKTSTIIHIYIYFPNRNILKIYEICRNKKI